MTREAERFATRQRHAMPPAQARRERAGEFAYAALGYTLHKPYKSPLLPARVNFTNGAARGRQQTSISTTRHKATETQSRLRSGPSRPLRRPPLPPGPLVQY